MGAIPEARHFIPTSTDVAALSLRAARSVNLGTVDLGFTAAESAEFGRVYRIALTPGI